MNKEKKEVLERLAGNSIGNFIMQIERTAVDNNLSYIDAIIHFCDKNAVEIETAASLLKSNAKMKARLQQEFEDMRLLPQRARLPGI